MPIVDIGGQAFATFASRGTVKDAATRTALALQRGKTRAAARAMRRIPEFSALGVPDVVLGARTLPGPAWTPAPGSAKGQHAGWFASYSGAFAPSPMRLLDAELASRKAIAEHFAVMGGRHWSGDAVQGVASLLLSPRDTDALQALRASGTTVVNDVTDAVQDKAHMAEAWQRAGIGMPDTVTGLGTDDAVAAAYDLLGPNVVLKAPRGARGDHVERAGSLDDAIRAAQSVRSSDTAVAPLMQRQLDIGGSDTRVHFSRDWATGELLPVGAVERATLGADFRTNLSAGGAVRPIYDLSGADRALTDDMLAEGARAGDALGLDWFAADVAINRATGKPVVFEVDTAAMPLERHFPVPREHQTMARLADLLLYSSNETLEAARGATLRGAS